jgi:hypothetical protein
MRRSPVIFRSRANGFCRERRLGTVGETVENNRGDNRCTSLLTESERSLPSLNMQKNLRENEH